MAACGENAVMKMIDVMIGASRSRRSGWRNESLNASSGMRKRPPLERMKKIYAQLQGSSFPNCSKLAKEFEVSVKTIARDIEFMRDRWGMPIGYDAKRTGFYFTESVEAFPGVPVTEKELFALCVAQKAIEQYKGTALEQPLVLAFEKVMGQLDDGQRFTLENLDDVLSFRPFAPDDTDLRLFELVTRALTERRALQFQYRKPGEPRADLRRVRPYHLMQFSNRWYLLAHDVERNDIRKFVLGRMWDVEMRDEQFEVPQDFDPKAHFNRSLGVMTGSDDFEVVIELDAWLTDVLRGRRLHPTQAWTEMPSGASRLRLRLSCLEEIEQWVLSWGAHATVLRPQMLVERIAETARQLASRYEPCHAEAA
jgi:predicted DNA-binding transcriptional regulator YafY